MTSLNPWDLSETDIRIPFMKHKRAQKAAIDRLGSKWDTSHDYFAVRWLFRNGVITDHQREVLVERIRKAAARRKAINPQPKGWRLY